MKKSTQYAHLMHMSGSFQWSCGARPFAIAYFIIPFGYDGIGRCGISLALRSVYDRGAAVDIEFLLAWHPSPFFFGKRCIEGFYRVGVLATIGCGAWNVHSPFAVKRVGHQLTDQQSCREIPVCEETDVFSFAADKAAADVVARIAEGYAYAMPHFSCCLKGMLN